MLLIDTPQKTHSAPSSPSWLRGTFNSLTLAGVLVLTLSAASAASSPKAPPTPSGFRVTATTAYSVTVVWNPAPANSGDFNYLLSGAYGVTPATLPKTATSHTFTGLYPGNNYWFFIYAKNAAGKVSGQASATTRTLRDTTPPWTAPVVSVTEVGSTYVNLSWTPARDDGPYQFYEVWLNGSLSFKTGKNVTSATIRFLNPATTYAIQVRAYDYGNNRSPFSTAVTVTTPPPNPNDTTPPTAPANLRGETFGDGSGETHVRWAQSTDDFDAPANIRYDVYLNGVWQDALFGSGGPSIIYLEPGSNTISVTATDTAGNVSAAVTMMATF
jgi:Fibronectin type III domain